MELESTVGLGTPSRLPGLLPSAGLLLRQRHELVLRDRVAVARSDGGPRGRLGRLGDIRHCRHRLEQLERAAEQSEEVAQVERRACDERLPPLARRPRLDKPAQARVEADGEGEAGRHLSALQLRRAIRQHVDRLVHGFGGREPHKRVWAQPLVERRGKHRRQLRRLELGGRSLHQHQREPQLVLARERRDERPKLGRLPPVGRVAVERAVAAQQLADGAKLRERVPALGRRRNLAPDPSSPERLEQARDGAPLEKARTAARTLLRRPRRPRRARRALALRRRRLAASPPAQPRLLALELGLALRRSEHAPRPAPATRAARAPPPATPPARPARAASPRAPTRAAAAAAAPTRSAARLRRPPRRRRRAPPTSCRPAG
mmetsp:Transcript_23657/g.74489  ORF Transcript_23657/g.74489 Transcript_23657/m.74489 type:complete len:377 (-) Transcript_23657:3-1133(-)